MTYPNGELEKMRLEICKKMITTTEALMEPVFFMPQPKREIPQPPMEKRPQIVKETIPDQTSLAHKTQDEQGQDIPHKTIENNEQNDNKDNHQRVENSTSESSIRNHSKCLK